MASKRALGVNIHFKSFQTSPVPPTTETRENDVADFSSPMPEKELECKTEEVGQLSLQDLARRIEEKDKELTKEKNRISEEKELILQQDKILQDMQIRLQEIEKPLEHFELPELELSKHLLESVETLEAEISRLVEKVDNCPSSPIQQRATVKPTQKSMIDYLGNILWQFNKLLTFIGCLCTALTFFHPIRICWYLDRIVYLYNKSWLLPH